MSPAMLAALKLRNPVLAFLLRIDLPSGRIVRLVDGAGYAIWNDDVFTGEDPEFGVIAGFGDFTESEGTEAPRQSVGLLFKSNAALAQLVAPAAQGSPVSIWAAAVDPETGAIIGEPDPRFMGELDDATFNIDRNSSLVELELATVWERLFDDNEGNRWNDTFWTYLFGPSARAFEHVTNAGQKLFWGYNGPSNGSGGSSYSGGGFIGGGGSYEQQAY